MRFSENYLSKRQVRRVLAKSLVEIHEDSDTTQILDTLTHTIRVSSCSTPLFKLKIQEESDMKNQTHLFQISLTMSAQ